MEEVQNVRPELQKRKDMQPLPCTGQENSQPMLPGGQSSWHSGQDLPQLSYSI